MHVKVPDKGKVLTLDSHCPSNSTSCNKSHRHSNSSNSFHESAANMTSRSHQFPQRQHGFHSTASSTHLASAALLPCQVIEHTETGNYLVLQNRARSVRLTKEPVSHPPITETPAVSDASKLKHSYNILSMEERSASSPIHAAGEAKVNVPEYSCKPIVRQRFSRNSSTASLTKINEVSTPSTLDDADAYQKPWRFSRACKRMPHIVVCASLCIILFSFIEKSTHVQVGDTKFATLHDRASDSGHKLRRKRRSAPINPHSNQVPVPDHELERSSADESLDHESPSAEDSEDQGGDDTPDNGDDGRAENPATIGNHGSDGKKVRPTLAYAQSLSSLTVRGVPNIKHDQDPTIYHNNINIMTDADEEYRNLGLRDKGIVQKKKRRPKLAQAKSLPHLQINNILPSSKQNEPSMLKDGHFIKNHGSYESTGESLVILYRDTTNQIILCLAWFFLVIFTMEAGAREMKRRHRLHQLR